MKRYPVYKDSRIDWLGAIPEHWDIIRIKRLSPVKRGASPRPIDNPKYFDDNGEFAWVRIADVTASNKYLLTTTQKLSKLGSALSVKQYPDDLFVSIAGSVGKPIITKIKCCIHDGFVYFPQLKINKDFIYYLFDAGQLFQGLGKFGTQLNLNTDTIGNIQIPFPPPEEQKAIAHFLDYKLEQIEQYIRNKKRLIELLNEQKNAIINRAVTKGINPNAPMKHSGIEWLGEIPAHWEVTRAKHVSFIFIPQRNKPELNFDNGFPWITMEDINLPSVSKSISGYVVDKNEALKAGSKPLPEGSVIASCVGNFGISSVNTVKVIIHQQLQAFIPTKINAYYLKYLIFISKEYFEQIATVTTLVYVNQKGFAELPIILPPPEEQKAIVFFIGSQSAKIDIAIAQIEKEIELIQEYRTTLISDAVTGKIDVRGFDNGSNSRNSPKLPELATM